MLLTTVRYYYTPNRVAEVQKIGYTTHWWGGGSPNVGKLKLTPTISGDGK